jgi:Trk K+ transport system NAD-binding subunit
VFQVLEQARVGRAHALISTTSNDLVNLEVSLLARELNQDLRVILHLEEPEMAEGLKEAANVLVALSIPTLSAPAFVVALFGDRVQSVFLVRGTLLAALDLVVPAADPLFTHQPLGVIAVDYGLVPIAVHSPTGVDLGLRRDQILLPGSRISALMDLTDLERLLRRHMAPRNWRIELTAPTQVPWSDLVALIPGSARVETGAPTGNATGAALAAHLTRGEAETVMQILQKLGVAARSLREDLEGAP